MAEIHPTAIIESGAKIANSAKIGAYAYIGAQVEIGERTVVQHHATVDGFTIMGKDNNVYPYAFIGGKTHDLKYVGGNPGLKIGDNNEFREYVTVHLATAPETFTIVGNNNHILAYSHIAHDCIVADGVVMSSHAALGGHVQVANNVVVAWNAGLHQFVRAGEYAMIGAGCVAVKDIPPFMMMGGSSVEVFHINKLNMRRNNFSEEEIDIAFSAFKTIYKKGLNRKSAIEELAKRSDASNRVVQSILSFLEASSDRGV